MLRSPSRLRRAIAALSGALLLQLSLLASGTLCPMHHGHGHSAAIEAATPVQHAVHHMADAPSPSPVPSGSCDMNGSACRTPWSPAGDCASMSTCATAVSVAAAMALDVSAAARTFVTAGPSASMPVGPTYAPELPPPRA